LPERMLRTVLAPLPSLVALTASPHVRVFLRALSGIPGCLSFTFVALALRSDSPSSRWRQSVDGRGERSEMRSVMRLFLFFVALLFSLFSRLNGSRYAGTQPQVGGTHREHPQPERAQQSRILLSVSILVSGTKPAVRLFRNALPRSSLAPTAQRYCCGNPQSRA
jgi:hypothetical protein